MSNLTEKRQQQRKAQRAQSAFDRARAMPMDLQQAIARQTLRECAETIDMLKALAERGEEPDSFYLSHLEEIEHRIASKERSAGPEMADGGTIALILACVVLLVSSGSKTSPAVENLAAGIVAWAERILPERSAFESGMAHSR